MTPIERAARALCQFHDAPEEGDGWKAYLPQVRAVLDAVHEPSDYMKEAGAQMRPIFGLHGHDEQ
ncbi:MAG: hypothetical protein VX218_16560, partial [Pseudomonadota bacterium]|nr:hypothetical protein [Pseudomonadota bacterium]